MKKILVLVLIVMTGFAFAAPPASTKVPAKTAQKPAPPPKETEREVSYADLGQFVGKRIIVHSALGTVRSGMLTHYTQSQIDIALDGNGAQLSFARDAIKSIAVPIAPEETQGGDSAKKN